MKKLQYSNQISILFLFVFLIANTPLVYSDVYINVMAVNATENIKESSISYNLPGDLKSTDILDTNGLDLDYNVNDANYVLRGKVSLQPKESKTFRIRVKDVWKLSQGQLDEIRKEIEQGYEQLGKQKDLEQAKLLKENLTSRLELLQDKSSKADSVEKRMDAYRTYSNELKRIENNALAVDYWRSDPSEIKKEKIIRFNIEIENPLDQPRDYKNKHYLPSEVKPEDLVEFEGFEIRFDQEKKTPFLFKEEKLQAKEKKKYTIGIRDIWFIPLKDTDYLRTRANTANDFLKDSKYAATAKILYENINGLLKNIDDLQNQKASSITEHISIFRDNQKTFDVTRTQVENLEKILSIYREDLEKSKVRNVLQKVQSLKGVSNVSKAVFEKTTVSESDSWKIIFWVLVFVGVLTVVSFLVWILRSKEQAIVTPEAQDKSDALKK